MELLTREQFESTFEPVRNHVTGELRTFRNRAYAFTDKGLSKHLWSVVVDTDNSELLVTGKQSDAIAFLYTDVPHNNEFIAVIWE